MGDYVDADLLGRADPATTVAVVELRIEGEPASRKVVYFKAAKDMAWPEPAIRASWRREGGGYVLELQSEALARGVWVDAGDADVSDNALTLLPGERVSLRVTSEAALATLQKNLRLQTLTKDISN